MTADGRLISILITVYNGAPYLAEAIDSALAQTHRPLEVIVVDDGSDDDSGAIARRYPSVRYHYQPRGGIGAARNQALDLATGDYLSFLDADDRFVPDKLTQQLRVLDERAEVDIVFGHVNEFISPDLPDDIATRLRRPAQNMPMMATSLMLARRSAFARVGYFATDLKVGISVDWYARAIEHGLTSYVLPSVVLERRLHSSNNGIRERDHRSQYLRVLKASIDRRRDAEGDAAA